MTSTEKPDIPLPPSRKFNQLDEDTRKIINHLFDKLIETSHFQTVLGVSKHESRKTLVEIFDNGELRIFCDKLRANGQIHPKSRIGLELWDCITKTYNPV